MTYLHLELAALFILAVAIGFGLAWAILGRRASAAIGRLGEEVVRTRRRLREHVREQRQQPRNRIEA